MKAEDLLRALHERIEEFRQWAVGDPKEPMPDLYELGGEVRAFLADPPQLQSGLVVPEEKPAKHPREYGPLEFTSGADRDDICRAIQVLVYRTQEHRIGCDPTTQGQRRAVVDMMIRLFLGDVEFEEKT